MDRYLGTIILSSIGYYYNDDIIEYYIDISINSLYICNVIRISKECQHS